MRDNLATIRAALTHLEVDDGEAAPVQPADDGVEVLKLGGQEGSEGSLQSHSTGLLEAHEVRSPNPSHVTSLRGVQGHQVELGGKKHLYLRIEVFFLQQLSF